MSRRAAAILVPVVAATTVLSFLARGDTRLTAPKLAIAAPSALSNYARARLKGARPRVVQEATVLANPAAWRDGIDQILRMPTAGPGVIQVGPAAPPSTQAWRALGPAPIQDLAGPRYADSGEIVDLAIDPSGTEDRTMFAASGQGGIWKTTNGGSTWVPKTDPMPSLSMGAVALDPRDPRIVYAATGNPFESNGGSSFRGVGLYKSTDGGDTWTIKGARELGPSASAGRGQSVYRLALGLEMDPVIAVGTVRTVLLVASSGGLLRSTDGGETFARVAAGDVTDVAADTLRPGVFYAAVAGVGLLRSTDGGRTFRENLFNDAAGRTKPGAPTGYDLLRFAQSSRKAGRRDGSTLYVSAARGLYRSTDSGATWSKPSTAPEGFDTQVRYDETVGVDPLDDQRVYVGRVGLWLSTDGGATFQGVGGVHADHHAIAFSPLSHTPSRGFAKAYVGTDGGLYAGNGGSFDNLNVTLNTTLVTQAAFSAADPRVLYACLWDHGCIGHRPDQSSGAFTKFLGGDGGAVAADPGAARTALATANSAFERTTDGGASLSSAVAMPGTPNRLAYLPKTLTDGRVTAWDAYAAVGDTLYLVAGQTRLHQFPAAISSVAASKSAPYAHWVGLYDGSVWKTENSRLGAFAVWRQIGAAGANDVAVVEPHPDRSGAAVAIFQPSNPALGTTRVITYTENNGATWLDLRGDPAAAGTGLPSVPVTSVGIVSGAAPANPGLMPRIVLGVDGAVLVSTSSTLASPSWAVLGTGLPHVRVSSMQILSARGTALVRVGTWGRGVWEWGAAP